MAEAFMELAPCPDCGGEMHVVFEDDTVCLECLHCGRPYGAGSPRVEARTLCVYWNLLLGKRNA